MIAAHKADAAGCKGIFDIGEFMRLKYRAYCPALRSDTRQANKPV
jgi:hypothetical protein